MVLGAAGVEGGVGKRVLSSVGAGAGVEFSSPFIVGFENNVRVSAVLNRQCFVTLKYEKSAHRRTFFSNECTNAVSGCQGPSGLTPA